MASIRRYVIRKRRCFVLLLFSCLLLTLLSSWFRMMLGYGEDQPLEENIVVPRVEPKYNVLEPPHFHANESSYSERRIGTDSELSFEARKATATVNTSSKTATMVPTKGTFQNQSEDIEVVKNKTLSQMGVLDGKESAKTIPKIVFLRKIWNLSVSFDDIGNIMKDTSFLNKLRPLNLSGPMLTSSRNRTSNFSLAMPLKMGYCDCWEHYCSCCVQLVSAQLHLSNKTCANFSFASKTHEMNVTFTIDSKPVYNGIISADAPPLLCLGSTPAVADMCVHFFNMTYRVDRLGLHKSQILGCADMSLNIYNKTISVFPVDCFQIPGDPNHHQKEEHIILPNFVP
ncbi:unnamed protein product [Candidula unifasciata]|uniref:DUF4773 domain-containing protein n=1 Tax=Candidula unifasciata TaxID=100452 RepID=A0A8S3YFM8_9EUPU|nr:unnamed protein product [Candidula unifasciata]